MTPCEIALCLVALIGYPFGIWVGHREAKREIGPALSQVMRFMFLLLRESGSHTFTEEEFKATEDAQFSIKFKRQSNNIFVSAGLEKQP